MTAPDAALLNAWPELRRLTPRLLTTWRILHDSAGEWITVNQIGESGGISAITACVYARELRRRLRHTRWAVGMRQANSRRYRLTSSSYQATAYRLEDQRAPLPVYGHCPTCGLSGEAALRAEQDAANAPYLVRHSDCEHVLAFWPSWAGPAPARLRRLIRRER